MGTFKLPDLGEGLAEAEILEWHVKPGDHVLVDQPMVSVETAKAVVEVPVPYSGTVTALHGAVGDIVATGAPLIDFDSGTVVGSMPVTSEEEFVDSAKIGRARGGVAARNRAVPMARALARRFGLDLADIAGSGPRRIDQIGRRSGARADGRRAGAGRAAIAGAAGCRPARPDRSRRRHCRAAARRAARHGAQHDAVARANPA